MFLPAALVVALVQPAAAPKFEIADGDRIVWIGNTLVEREQRYGYWETALHAAFPDKQFTLRNLGWSGDTVHGDARAGFENAAKGFERLVSLTLELKPTVIFVSYGTNESFEGEAGLPKFEKGLEKLLDALKPSKARVVLFTPLPFQKSDAMPDPTIRNRDLERYAWKIERIALEREHLFAKPEVQSFIEHLEPRGKPLTENGLHWNEMGYAATAVPFVRSLKPYSPLPVVNGRYEALRQAIVAKNELFFHRWRPENETYLLGFRKHEQGNNAVEIKQFEPLVAKADEEIETIRKKLKD